VRLQDVFLAASLGGYVSDEHGRPHQAAIATSRNAKPRR
jgi:hypothetical protein